MYVPDTLKRLNDKAVEAAIADAAEIARLRGSWSKAHKMLTFGEYLERKRVDYECCDCCSEPAIEAYPVYNPADGVRGVKGAYFVAHLCAEHAGEEPEETFICDGCGERFATHHSWDSLVCRIGDAPFCHACAADRAEGVTLAELLQNLREGETGGWPRINALPGKELLWEGEFSQWSDFPGHTSPGSIAQALEEAANEAGLPSDTTVYPVLLQTFQFSVVLGVYHD
jgi:hypothetical protein